MRARNSTTAPQSNSFYDGFNRANNSSLGGDWTARNGTMGITGNTAYGSTSGAFNAATYATQLTSDDQSVTVTLGVMTGSPANDAVFCILGANNAGTEWAFGYIYQGAYAQIYTAGNWNLAASYSLKVTGVVSSFAPGDKLEFRRTDNIYSMLLNDTPLPGAAWADNTNVLPRNSSHRYVGIGGYNATEYRAVDDWSAKNSVVTPATQLTGVGYAQSSQYAGTTYIEYTYMNSGSADGSANNNEAVTNSQAGAYFLADVGAIKYISHIIIGYDYLTNLSPGTWGVTYTEGLNVLCSTNGSVYTTVAVTPTYASSGSSNGLVKIAICGSWRYVGLQTPGTNNVVLLEFEVWGYQ